MSERPSTRPLRHTGGLTYNHIVKFIALLLVALVPLAVCDGAGPTTERKFKILFVRDGNIWIANGDGSGRTMIVHDANHPCWSPDRKRFAFRRDADVWIADATGKYQRPLTHYPKELAPKPSLYRVDVDSGSILAWGRHDNVITFWGYAKEEGKWQPAICEAPAEARSKIPIKERLGYATDGWNLGSPDALAWSEDGNSLAFSCSGDILLTYRNGPRFEGESHPEWGFENYSWEAIRLAAVAQYDNPSYRASREDYGVTKISWLPGNGRLVYGIERLGGSGFAQVRLLRFKIGDSHYRLGVPQIDQDQLIADDAWDPAASPDGRLVAFHCSGHERDIVIRPVKGGTMKLLIKNADQLSW